jgi:hypothetical protein
MDIMKIFTDTAYVRVGGTTEELFCADYLRSRCAEFGGEAHLEPFCVDMATVLEAVLEADGVSIPCKGYRCAGSAQVEAPFYYLADKDPNSLAQCRGKIVLVDGYLGYWIYQDLLENGALGFITYDGHINYADRDMDDRELRSYVHNGRKIPGVNINVKDAVALVEKGTATVRITLRQTEKTGTSHNVVLDLPGQIPETIVLTAHYDSTALSTGAYDNMSGSAGLLALAEHFSRNPHRYSLRFLWCGSEERGLLGSKAYCQAHKEELEKIVLCVNLDMIGSIMGKFIACCSAEEKLCHYISYLGSELGFGVEPKQDVYASDSTPFADSGVPSLSFARLAPPNTGTIHNRYDTTALLSPAQMERDIAFISAFVSRMANAVRCPVERTIPEAVKEKLDLYLNRKRK